MLLIPLLHHSGISIILRLSKSFLAYKTMFTLLISFVFANSIYWILNYYKIL